MKRIIFITFLMVSMLARGQELKFFLPDSNAYFSISNMKFLFHNDTIINGITYKKVYREFGNVVPLIENATYYAAVREDTLYAKIYCLHENDDQERLIADFNVSINDWITVYSFFFGDTPEEIVVRVIAVDSTLVNQQWRKRVSVVSNNTDFWIEGIGSSFGLFYPGGTTNAVGLPELLCVHINDEIIYSNPYHDSCYKEIEVNTESIENEKNDFLLFPTIASDKIYFSTLTGNYYDYNYMLLDSNGKYIKGDIFTSNYIDISYLPHGIYFLSIANNKSCGNKTIKFIKQ